MKLTDKQKTQIILNALKEKYLSWGRSNVLFPELRLGSGYNDIAQRRIDMFIVSSEKGNLTSAFEIKVSRQDFTKDIKDPLKQRGARLYANNFFYVAPKGLIKIEEIPLWSGLLEYDFEEDKFYTTVPAPLSTRNNPSWGLICSIVRKIRSQTYVDKLQELRNLLEANYREQYSTLTCFKNYINNDEKSEHKELAKTLTLSRIEKDINILERQKEILEQMKYI